MLNLMKTFLLAACLLTILTGCANFQKHDPLTAVSRVDLDRFMGTWYVIGTIPTIYDRAAFNSVETYERAERGVKIDYSFNTGKPDGKLKTFSARAMIIDPGLNANWEVTYVTWPFERDYKIIRVESDYSVAVIGQPSRKNVWILSRSKTIESALYSDIILSLQDNGYDVGKIRTVPHQ